MGGYLRTNIRVTYDRYQIITVHNERIIIVAK